MTKTFNVVADVAKFNLTKVFTTWLEYVHDLNFADAFWD